MENQFERYSEERQKIYDPLLATLNDGSPSEYLVFLEYLLFKQSNLIIDIGQGNEDDISYIVNACCYCLINYLNLSRYDRDISPESLDLLTRLLKLLQEARNNSLGYYLTPFFERQGENTEDTAIMVPSHYERLEQLLKVYQERASKSKYFSASVGAVRSNHHRILSKSIMRYPSIYADVLGTDANKVFRQKFAKEKQQKQQDYSVSLYQHLVYELSGGRTMIGGMVDIKGTTNLKGDNPSRLELDDLRKSVNFFADISNTNSVAIFNKLVNSQSTEQFKWELHKTILDFLPERHQTSFFGTRLMARLGSLFSHYVSLDSAKLVSIISRLLSFLIIEGDHNHYIFVNLLSNIGSKRVLGMLVNLARLCPDKDKFPLKDEIDRRLAWLFKHYSDYPEIEVQWLIRLLENYNVATAVIFEKFDIQGLKMLERRRYNN